MFYTIFWGDILDKYIDEVLFSEKDIAQKVSNLGEMITKDYSGEELLVIGVLKGANVFLSDLIRKIELPVEIDFIAVSSYGVSTESSGVVRLIKDLDYSIEGRNVLIIEDIIDTGLTLNYLYNNFKSRNPKSIKICTFLDKPQRRKINIPVDYIGYKIPDEFIVGYGIDYAEKFRNLPYIATVKNKINP